MVSRTDVAPPVTVSEEPRTKNGRQALVEATFGVTSGLLKVPPCVMHADAICHLGSTPILLSTVASASACC
jgi:hypothetical protein